MALTLAPDIRVELQPDFGERLGVLLMDDDDPLVMMDYDYDDDFLMDYDGLLMDYGGL